MLYTDEEIQQCQCRLRNKDLRSTGLDEQDLNKLATLMKSINDKSDCANLTVKYYQEYHTPSRGHGAFLHPHTLTPYTFWEFTAKEYYYVYDKDYNKVCSLYKGYKGIFFNKKEEWVMLVDNNRWNRTPCIPIPDDIYLLPANNVVWTFVENLYEYKKQHTKNIPYLGCLCKRIPCCVCSYFSKKR